MIYLHSHLISNPRHAFKNNSIFRLLANSLISALFLERIGTELSKHHSCSTHSPHTKIYLFKSYYEWNKLEYFQYGAESIATHFSLLTLKKYFESQEQTNRTCTDEMQEKISKKFENCVLVVRNSFSCIEEQSRVDNLSK